MTANATDDMILKNQMCNLRNSHCSKRKQKMWLELGGGAVGGCRAQWENAVTHCCFQIRKKEIKLFKVLRSSLMDCCPSLMFHTGEPHTLDFVFKDWE